MKKYIHYCWFGGNPLPKLAKKCIESWKKYLPDYEIIEWNESNVDLEECPFIKEAYENKKWAFVADYARTKAIYEMGGIYFDTDMLITKPIDFLLKDETFLGLEDSFMVNAAVWGASKPKTYFAKKMLDFYQSQEHFDLNNIFSISIPRIITRLLNEEGLDHTSNEVQHLKHGITVYPREYFYPLSFNFKNNVFTDNTCMIHYFDASWFSKKEKIRVKLSRKFGEKKVEKVLGLYRKVRYASVALLKKVLYRPAKYVKYNFLNKGKYSKEIDDVCNTLRETKGDYVVFHNPNWLGTTSATIELFNDNRVPCGEFYTKRSMKKVGNLILEKDIKQVIFSAMCIGWKDLAYYLKKKNPNILIKVFWHGSLSQVYEPYGWARNIELINMAKDGVLTTFGICKESLMNFYRALDINVKLITNNVNLNSKYSLKKSKNVSIGIYSSSKDNWLKNLFTQIAAASLIKDVTVDIVPMDSEIANFATSLGLKVTGVDKLIPREELLKRMSANTINLYVTFSECAPMLPIESFEVGTICLTGNNHHYFKNTELEKYLVIDNEENPVEIAEKAELCINNKDKILELYKKWKKENNNNSSMSVAEFLEDRGGNN